MRYSFSTSGAFSRSPSKSDRNGPFFTSTFNYTRIGFTTKSSRARTAFEDTNEWIEKCFFFFFFEKSNPIICNFLSALQRGARRYPKDKVLFSMLVLLRVKVRRETCVFASALSYLKSKRRRCNSKNGMKTAALCSPRPALALSHPHRRPTNYPQWQIVSLHFAPARRDARGALISVRAVVYACLRSFSPLFVSLTARTREYQSASRALPLLINNRESTPIETGPSGNAEDSAHAFVPERFDTDFVSGALTSLRNELARYVAATSSDRNKNLF